MKDLSPARLPRVRKSFGGRGGPQPTARDPQDGTHLAAVFLWEPPYPAQNSPPPSRQLDLRPAPSIPGPPPVVVPAAAVAALDVRPACASGSPRTAHPGRRPLPQAGWPRAPGPDVRGRGGACLRGPLRGAHPGPASRPLPAPLQRPAAAPPHSAQPAAPGMGGKGEEGRWREGRGIPDPSSASCGRQAAEGLLLPSPKGPPRGSAQASSTSNSRA